MPDRADRLELLLHALRAEGSYGRTMRRRFAATLGLVLLLFAVLAVAGLYAVALAGIGMLVCSVIAVAAMMVVRPHRATIVARARESWSETHALVGRSVVRCRPVVVRRANELVAASHRLWEQRPTNVPVGDWALQATDAARVLAARARPTSKGAQVREAFRLNAAGAQLRRDGAFAEAAERHRQALDMFDELGDRRAAALTQNNLALALDRVGDDAAIELFEEAATTLGALGDEQSEGQVIANLAVVLRRRGQEQRAEEALVRALEKLEQDSPEYHQVDSLRRAS